MALFGSKKSKNIKKNSIAQTKRIDVLNEWLKLRGEKSIHEGGFCNGDSLMWLISMQRGTSGNYYNLSRELSNMNGADLHKLDKEHEKWVEDRKKNPKKKSKHEKGHQKYLDFLSYYSTISLFQTPRQEQFASRQTHPDQLNTDSGLYLSQNNYDQLANTIMGERLAEGDTYSQNQVTLRINNMPCFNEMLKYLEGKNKNQQYMFSIPGRHAMALVYIQEPGKLKSGWYFHDPNLPHDTPHYCKASDIYEHLNSNYFSQSQTFSQWTLSVSQLKLDSQNNLFEPDQSIINSITAENRISSVNNAIKACKEPLTTQQKKDVTHELFDLLLSKLQVSNSSAYFDQALQLIKKSQDILDKDTVQFYLSRCFSKCCIPFNKENLQFFFDLNTMTNNGKFNPEMLEPLQNIFTDSDFNNHNELLEMVSPKLEPSEISEVFNPILTELIIQGKINQFEQLYSKLPSEQQQQLKSKMAAIIVKEYCASNNKIRSGSESSIIGIVNQSVFDNEYSIDEIISALNYAINFGSSIDHILDTYGSALHIAAERGNLSIVKFLVENGAYVDNYEDGFTPQDKSESTECIEFLEEWKNTHQVQYFDYSNPSMPLPKIKNDILRFIVLGQTDMLDDILSKLGKDRFLEQLENNLFSEVFNRYYCVECDSIDELKKGIQWLLNKGVDINSGQPTALWSSAYHSDLEMTKWLVKIGADINIKYENLTAKEIAFRAIGDHDGAEDVFKYLKQEQARRPESVLFNSRGTSPSVPKEENPSPQLNSKPSQHKKNKSSRPK